jgi:hypothetical protein
MNVDWVKVYEAARRSSMAYEMDPVKSESLFSSTGLHWLGIYQNDGHQAVVCLDNHGDAYLSISGTRFGKRVWDLVDDSWLIPRSLDDGIHVTSGAFDGMSDLWAWANLLVTPSTLWHVEGHSLGAWRTRYTPVFLPANRIGRLHSFESPKGANRAYWDKYKQELAQMVSVVNGRDLFVDWPFVSVEWEHPHMLPIQWLNGNSVLDIFPCQWPGGRSIPDHSIDVVVEKCKKLAGL